MDAGRVTVPPVRRPDPPLPPVFSYAQARRAGLTRRQIQHRVETRRWRRLRVGCYCLSSTWDAADRRGRHLLMTTAAVLSTGPRHWASHASAAVLYGLPMPFADVPVMLTHPPGTATQYLRGLEIMAATLVEEQRSIRAGLPSTTEARAVADCLRRLSTVDGVVVADAALHRTPRLRPVVESVLSSMAGWPYAEHGGSSWRLVDGRRESPAESLSYVAMHRQELPIPEPQALVYDEGGRFVARVDAWWDDCAVVGEVDGRVKYEVKEGEDADAARRRLVTEKKREDALRRLDARVVRWGTRDLADEREWAAGVRRELALGDRRRFRGTIRRTPFA